MPKKTDKQPEQPIVEEIAWTPDDEAAADRAMNYLNQRWDANQAQGVDVDAQMAREVDELGDDEDEGSAS